MSAATVCVPTLAAAPAVTVTNPKDVAPKSVWMVCQELTL